MDILVSLLIVGFLVLVGVGVWLVVRGEGPSGIVAELAGAIGMELLGLAAIVLFVGGALLVILLTDGGPAVGLIAIPFVVIVMGIILWRLRH